MFNRKDQVKIQDNVLRTLTTNDTYIIEPAEGFDAMSKATIEVNVPQERLQNSKSVTITSNGSSSVTPDEGYDGIRTVSVVTNVPSNNELWTNKRFTSNNQTYTISNLMNDSTKDGISKDSTIVIDVPEPSITQISNYSITSNSSGTPTVVPIPQGYDAVDSISLNVNVPQPQPAIMGLSLSYKSLLGSTSYPSLKSIRIPISDDPIVGLDGWNEVYLAPFNAAQQSVSITSNGDQYLTMGLGFSSLSNDYTWQVAKITTNVQPTLMTKSITTNGTYTPDTGYDGFSSVTVDVAKPVIDRIGYPTSNGGMSSKYLKNFTYASSNSTQTLSSKYYLITTTDFSTYNLIWNTTTTSQTYTVSSGTYYMKDRTYGLIEDYYCGLGSSSYVFRHYFPKKTDSTAIGLLITSKFYISSTTFNIVTF